MPAVYVKPREGGRIRMPERGFAPMPEEGAWVERHSDYYNRLIFSGDLIITEPPPPAPEAIADNPTTQTDATPAAVKRTSKEK